MCGRSSLCLGCQVDTNVSGTEVRLARYMYPNARLVMEVVESHLAVGISNDQSPVRQSEYSLVDHWHSGVLEIGQAAYSNCCGGPVPVALEHLSVDILCVPNLDHQRLRCGRYE